MFNIKCESCITSALKVNLGISVLLFALFFIWAYRCTNLVRVRRQFTKKLKNFLGSFEWMRFNCFKATVPLRGDCLLFSTKSPGVSGSYWIDLGRMKGWVELGATLWLDTGRELNVQFTSCVYGELCWSTSQSKSISQYEAHKVKSHFLPNFCLFSPRLVIMIYKIPIPFDLELAKYLGIPSVIYTTSKDVDTPLKHPVRHVLV